MSRAWKFNKGRRGVPGRADRAAHPGPGEEMPPETERDRRIAVVFERAIKPAILSG